MTKVLVDLDVLVLALSNDPHSAYARSELRSLISQSKIETLEAPQYPKSNIPHPHDPGYRVVGFRIKEGDAAFGSHGLSEPVFWLDTLLQPKAI